MDFPLLSAFFRDPVVSESIVFHQFLTLCFGEDRGERSGNRRSSAC
jgi:hypothetical protein